MAMSPENQSIARNPVCPKGVDRVARLKTVSGLGRRPAELLPDTRYREVVVPPCRVFYRVEGCTAFLLDVMRSERLLRTHLLEQRRLQADNPERE